MREGMLGRVVSEPLYIGDITATTLRFSDWFDLRHMTHIERWPPIHTLFWHANNVLMLNENICSAYLPAIRFE